MSFLRLCQSEGRHGRTPGSTEEREAGGMRSARTPFRTGDEARRRDGGVGGSRIIGRIVGRRSVGWDEVWPVDSGWPYGGVSRGSGQGGGQKGEEEGHLRRKTFISAGFRVKVRVIIIIMIIIVFMVTVTIRMIMINH